MLNHIFLGYVGITILYRCKMLFMDTLALNYKHSQTVKTLILTDSRILSSVTYILEASDIKHKLLTGALAKTLCCLKFNVSNFFHKLHGMRPEPTS